jgi:hypothetical protein
MRDGEAVMGSEATATDRIGEELVLITPAQALASDQETGLPVRRRRR